MQSEEIRTRFLKFFEKRGHTIVRSSSLLPSDPSVLLTTAGMQQFKPYFTGELDPMKEFGSKNTASIQKSFRTSDIEEVGDNTHLTFFEMLGNFSFGGYFKKEAIQYAYEFVTQELGLPISYVTVFKGSSAVPKDDESRQIWHSLGVKDVREEGMEDVFWGPTGSAGPCGPTTEIYCKNAAGSDVEVWNIVFNQFLYSGSREELLAGNPAKTLTPLKTPGIDTGAGFERLAAITQGVSSPYETDLFRDVIAKIAELKNGLEPRVVRIIADHIRASAFLIADGLRPSNKEAGYVLRRLLRRMLAYKIQYDIHGRLFEELVPVIQQKFGIVYPELKSADILPVMLDEQKKFEKVVANGIGELKKHASLTAADAFAIASTYGLNFELMREMAPNATKDISIHDYEREFKKHQELSRAGTAKKFGGHGLLLDTGELKAADERELKVVTRLHTATHMLQQALRTVLGPEVHQAGSDITVERTRFDFSFPRKVTKEEIEKVEALVNEKIKEDLPMQKVVLPKKEAEKTGALFFFKEKYPDPVNVYFIGKDVKSAWSKEFCGGPHVTHTGEIGAFKIVKEEAVGSGVRRIRAVVM